MEKAFHTNDLASALPYFTGLEERTRWLESDLEQALMDRLERFLLELGRDFFFVARQKRISVETEHNYIDLVLVCVIQPKTSQEYKASRAAISFDTEPGFQSPSQDFRVEPR